MYEISMITRISALCSHRISYNQHMSRVMKKTAFCICENKNTDQLCGKREADQRPCFCYKNSTIPLLHQSIFCGCTARFVSDLVRKPEDWFSQNTAQIIKHRSLDRAMTCEPCHEKICFLHICENKGADQLIS